MPGPGPGPLFPPSGPRGELSPIGADGAGAVQRPGGAQLCLGPQQPVRKVPEAEPGVLESRPCACAALGAGGSLPHITHPLQEHGERLYSLSHSSQCPLVTAILTGSAVPVSTESDSVLFYLGVFCEEGAFVSRGFLYPRVGLLVLQ